VSPEGVAVRNAVESGIDTDHFAMQSKNVFARRDFLQRLLIIWFHLSYNMIMNRIQLSLLLFCAFLGLVIYTEDVGAGSRYWGWVNHVPLGDKLCHCAFMFTFSVLTNLALRCRAIHLGGQTVLLGTVIVTIVVVAEEFSQLWIPGRDFDLLDLAADLIGIACGTLVARKLQGEHRATMKVNHATHLGA
jgi:polysaccharide biosynthesis protein VpsQ